MPLRTLRRISAGDVTSLVCVRDHPRTMNGAFSAVLKSCKASSWPFIPPLLTLVIRYIDAYRCSPETLSVASNTRSSGISVDLSLPHPLLVLLPRRYSLPHPLRLPSKFALVPAGLQRS